MARTKNTERKMASSGMTPATFGDIDASESAESDGNPKWTCTYDGCNRSYSSSSSRNRHMLHTHAQHPDGRPATVEERATASKTFNPAAALVEKRTEHQSKVSGAKRKTIEAWSGGEPTSVAKRAPEGAVIRAAAARSAPSAAASAATSASHSERPENIRASSSATSTDVELPKVAASAGLRGCTAGWPSREVPATEVLYKMYRALPEKSTLEVTAVVKEHMHLSRTATRVVRKQLAAMSHTERTMTDEVRRLLPLDSDIDGDTAVDTIRAIKDWIKEKPVRPKPTGCFEY